VHCNIVFGKMLFPLLSAAVQIRLTAGLCQCKFNYKDLLFIQLCSEPTPVHCNIDFGKFSSHYSVLLCKSSSQQFCVCANTTMEICSSYRCAVTQHQCTATLYLANFISLLSAAVQIRLTAGLCRCIYTYGDLLLIQVCSDPAPVHCNIVFGKMLFPLLSAAVQIRLTAGLCQCKFNYKDLLFIQLCSEPTPVHCHADFGKFSSHYSVLLCKSSSQQFCVCANTTMESCSSYKCAVTHHQCTATLFLAN